MTENPLFHDKTKHIDIHNHYIHDMVQKGAIKLQYVGTDEQVADVFIVEEKVWKKLTQAFSDLVKIVGNVTWGLYLLNNPLIHKY
jgi:hypothetical protein